MAALVALALLTVLATLAFLVAPYARLLALEVAELVRNHPEEPYSYAPFAAGAGAAVAAVQGWWRGRRPGTARAGAASRAAAGCARRWSSTSSSRRRSACAGAAAEAVRPVELGAELRKMAPPNGRTVLIFRAPCGCPKGRMEVWGAKKVRRIKK